VAKILISYEALTRRENRTFTFITHREYGHAADA